MYYTAECILFAVSTLSLYFMVLLAWPVIEYKILCFVLCKIWETSNANVISCNRRPHVCWYADQKLSLTRHSLSVGVRVNWTSSASVKIHIWSDHFPFLPRDAMLARY